MAPRGKFPSGRRALNRSLTAVNASEDQERDGINVEDLTPDAPYKFPPGPASSRAVLLDQPLARPAQLQARAVHQQVHGLGARPWSWDLQGLGPAAQGGVVRHREIETKQMKDGADQAFGLAQRQAEH